MEKLEPKNAAIAALGAIALLLTVAGAPPEATSALSSALLGALCLFGFVGIFQIGVPQLRDADEAASLLEDAEHADRVEDEQILRAGFERRWLQMAGVEFDELDDCMERARDRIARYPRGFRYLRAAIVFLLQWIAPLAFLGTFSRASRLSTNAFETLMERLREHRISALRLASLSAVTPLMEVIFEDEPQQQPEHPLEEPLRTHRPDPNTDYDVIVIGSGAGGAPAATRLAERGAEVALVEKGDLVGAEETSNALEQYYVNQGLFGVVRGTPMVVMAGSTVGGTTSINAGTSLRPSDNWLERWDRRLQTNFASGALDPWLDQVEEAIGVKVPPDWLRSRSSQKVVEGLDALGRDGWFPLPRNASGCEGSGRCCFGCPTGAKQGTDRAFLPRALDAGADLYTEWEATSIEENDACVRIEIEGADGREVLEADRLVLAAGAIYTPLLIRRNRLGSHWQQAGEGFKTHPASKVFALFDDVERPKTAPGMPQGIGYEPPELERVAMEGAEIPPSSLGPALPVGGARFRRWFQQHRSVLGYGAMVCDRNTGSIREFRGRPVLDYDLHPDDAADLVRSMQLISETFFAAGAQRVLLPFPAKENEFTSMEEVAAIDPDAIAPDQLNLGGFHAQGTAGMGRVVDTDLELKGSDRISVCDASVLPESPGVNPQVTIMALSLRLADQLARPSLARGDRR